MFRAIFMPVIIEFSRCIGTYSSAKFELIIYALVSFFTGNTVPGWSSSLIATSFMGGIQMISLGVIGEYIGKMYLEAKERPRYIVSERRIHNEKIESGDSVSEDQL